MANLSDKDIRSGIVRSNAELFVNHINFCKLPNNTYIIVDKKVLYLQLEFLTQKLK